jgi:FHS family L-fucose permease-like MFS transporter
LATAPARATSAATPNTGASANYVVPLSILTSLFFMWGFLTCLNDILIPHLKASFSLSYVEVQLVQFCFFGAYFIVSLPAGSLVGKLGYQRGIVVGLLIAGVGCLLFYPAAATRLYPLFLGALFTLAVGITILQVSANPYVAILGPPETASARLTMTQAFNSLGTFLAPFFGAALILGMAQKGDAEVAKLSAPDAVAYRAAEASSVQLPYLGLAAVLVVIAIVIGSLKLPTISAPEALKDGGHAGEHAKSAWSYRHLVLGAVAIFVYVGAEVSIGSFLVNFFGQEDIAGLSPQAAGRRVAYYWGGAMVGRFIGSALMVRIRPGVLLAVNAAVASGLVLLTMLLGGEAAMWSILAVGLFNSIMFPTIFSLGIDGLGPHTEQGSGILCMGIVGGALLPVLQGALADSIGIHKAFIVPALCYLYIIYYGLKGSQHAPLTAAS